MPDRTAGGDPLAALGVHLGAHRFAVELTARGLRVVNPDVPGCCAETPQAADVVTWRVRPEDFGNPWFFTSWGEPIAPVDRITDAKVFILGYLAERRARRAPSPVVDRGGGG